MSKSERIVAVGLLTQADLDILGAGFTRAFPIDTTPSFEDLLRSIDEVDKAFRSEQASPSHEPR